MTTVTFAGGGSSEQKKPREAGQVIAGGLLRWGWRSARKLRVIHVTRGSMDQAGMLKIRDRLQASEDELVAAGLDEFIVACDAGTWTWRTAGLARAEHSAMASSRVSMRRDSVSRLVCTSRYRTNHSAMALSGAASRKETRVRAVPASGQGS